MKIMKKCMFPLADIVLIVFSEKSNKKEERILLAVSIVLAVAFVFVTLWNVNLLHRF